MTRLRYALAHWRARRTLAAYLRGHGRAAELAALHRDTPPATVPAAVAAQAQADRAARHDLRAHLDAGDPHVYAIVSGCQTCIVRYGDGA